MSHKEKELTEQEICVEKRGPSGPLKCLSYNTYLTALDEKYMDGEITKQERAMRRTFYKIAGKPIELWYSEAKKPDTRNEYYETTKAFEKTMDEMLQTGKLNYLDYRKYMRQYFDNPKGAKLNFSWPDKRILHTVERQGHYIELKKWFLRDSEIKVPEKKRGRVKPEFSSSAARNLRNKMSRVDWENTPKENIYEIVLTYHKQRNNGKDIKIHLDNFLKRIREWYNARGFWKLEYTKKGRPHFHIVMVTDETLDLGHYALKRVNKLSFVERTRNQKKVNDKTIFYSTCNPVDDYIEGERYRVQEAWNRITKGNENHFNAGIEMEHVKKPHSMATYMTEYLAGIEKKGKRKNKSYQNKAPKWAYNIGRWWGYFNKEALFPERIYDELNEKQYNILVKVLEDYIRVYKKGYIIDDDRKVSICLNNIENNDFYGELIRLIVDEGINEPKKLVEHMKQKTAYYMLSGQISCV